MAGDSEVMVPRRINYVVDGLHRDAKDVVREFLRGHVPHER